MYLPIPTKARAATAGVSNGRAASPATTRRVAAGVVRLAFVCAAVLFFGAMPGCQNVIYSYPFNGQQSVPLNARVALKLKGSVDNLQDGAVELRSAADTDPNSQGVALQNISHEGQFLQLVPEQSLKPGTTYKVVAAKEIQDAGVAQGSVLTQFTTRPNLVNDESGNSEFEVTEASPGNTNPVTGETTPFVGFNAVRVVFSQPVAADSVTVGQSFKFVGPDGNQVPGRLLVGRNKVTFDPDEDLAGGDYRLELTDNIQSAYGESLQAFSRTEHVLPAQGLTANLFVQPTADSVGELPPNVLNGDPTNVVTIDNPLIGRNQQIASDAPSRGSVAALLGLNGGFGEVIPAVVRAGQRFKLTPLDLKLNGKVPTVIQGDPIIGTFPTDASVNLLTDSLAGDTPVPVRLRFDLAISTLVGNTDGPETMLQKLANGAFNQTIMNVQASGLATGGISNLSIAAFGSFPIRVNRNDPASVDFELTLKVDSLSDTPKPDNTPPFITAVSPSACTYVSGVGALDLISGSESQCIDALGNPSAPVNTYPLTASPAITFSEPIDAATVDSQSIQLTQNGNPVAADYQVDGTTVIINPDEPLDADTQYQLRVGNGASVADFAGNALDAGGGSVPMPVTLRTAPIDPDDSTSPLLSSLRPGEPCVLAYGNFKSGGDVAGDCTGGDDPGANNRLPVFGQPSNVPIKATFSKRIQPGTIKLADGCIANGSGPASGNTVAGATIAVQRMDGSGQCQGVVDGRISLPHPGLDATSRFSFTPSDGFEPGQRYWLVLCGSGSTAQCSAEIKDLDGRALNTDPLNGSQAQSSRGGPPLVMPFDGEPVTKDYYTTLFTAPPITDTNANGRVDDEERIQPANRVLIGLSAPLVATINNPNRDDNRYPSYLSLASSVVIRADRNPDCSAVAQVTNENGQSAVGATPNDCVEVSLLPGGLIGLTNVTANAKLLGLLRVLTVKTGRIFLRFGETTNGGSSQLQPQSAYIVPECTGTLNGEAYDYKPCLTASLTLTANAPDTNSVVQIDQQKATANVVGPVSFEQNGRLVGALRNVNQFTLQARAVSLIPATATVAPGGLHFQLVGNATHGGRALPLTKPAMPISLDR